MKTPFYHVVTGGAGGAGGAGGDPLPSSMNTNWPFEPMTVPCVQCGIPTSLYSYDSRWQHYCHYCVHDARITHNPVAKCPFKIPRSRNLASRSQLDK